jgi:hypothetical protein
MVLRRIVLGMVGLLTVLALIAGAAYWSSQQAPSFYVEATAPPAKPEVRREQAKSFEERTVKLAEQVREADAWHHEFSQDQINAWLAEELSQRFGDQIPRGVSDPRVRLTDGAIDVGFRAEDPKTHLQTVVSVRLVPLAVSTNQVTVAISSLRAGLMPLPADRVLAEGVARLEAAGWKIVRSTRDGADVLEIDLTDALPPGATLESLRIEAGRLDVEGHGAGGADKPMENPNE